MELLVQGKDLPKHETTWELHEEICQPFPNFNLEDKVPLNQGVMLDLLQLIGMLGGVRELHPGLFVRLSFIWFYVKFSN